MPTDLFLAPPAFTAEEDLILRLRAPLVLYARVSGSGAASGSLGSIISLPVSGIGAGVSTGSALASLIRAAEAAGSGASVGQARGLLRFVAGAQGLSVSSGSLLMLDALVARASDLLLLGAFTVEISRRGEAGPAGLDGVAARPLSVDAALPE